MRHAENGVTLVEVLLSVVICAVGLVIVAQGIAAGLRVELNAGNRERAALLATSLVSNIESGEVALEEAKGNFETEGEPGFSWSVETENTDVEGLIEARMFVHWEERGATRSFQVVRLFYQDPEAGGGVIGAQTGGE